MKIYDGTDLTDAIDIIFHKDSKELIKVYRYSRHARAAAERNRIYSKKLGVAILNVITTDENAFKKLLSDLPCIADVTIEEFEMIIYTVFNKLPECKVNLINFVSGFGGKAKISKSKLPKEIKEELTSYLIINKISS